MRIWYRKIISLSLTSSYYGRISTKTFEEVGKSPLWHFVWLVRQPRLSWVVVLYTVHYKQGRNRVRPRSFGQVGHQTTNASRKISTFSLMGKIQPILDTEKMTLKLRIFRSLTRLFIILVSLTRSLFGEKCSFPIDALVASPNLMKKSWTISREEGARKIIDWAMMTPRYVEWRESKTVKQECHVRKHLQYLLASVSIRVNTTKEYSLYLVIIFQAFWKLLLLANDLLF